MAGTGRRADAVRVFVGVAVPVATHDLCNREKCEANEQRGKDSFYFNIGFSHEFVPIMFQKNI